MGDTRNIGDPREALLTAIATALAGIPGVETFKRNDPEIAEAARPAILMMDGDETTQEQGFGRGRPANGAIIMQALPEIYVMIGDNPETVGAGLNAIRAKIIYAMLNTPAIAALCKDADIRYEGSQSALALGRSMEGEMGLNFTFIYVLRPSIQPT